MPIAPPPPAAPARRPLTRRQRRITAAGLAFVVLGVAALPLLRRSELEQAGHTIGRDCTATTTTEAELRFTADYGSTACLLATREQLERLGFDRGDLERAADRPVTAGRYTMTAVERRAGGNAALLVTIRRN